MISFKNLLSAMGREELLSDERSAANLESLKPEKTPKGAY